MVQRLTIENVEKLNGKNAHKNWEISSIVVGMDYYKFYLISDDKYNPVSWSMTLDRGMWGDGYRLFVKDLNANTTIDVYFQSYQINTIDGFCKISNELINNVENYGINN